MAKNKSHDEQIQRGLKALRKAQVPLDAPGPELVARLKEEFGKSRDIDLAVVFSLGKTYDPAASDALGDIERRTGDKDVKKEIKRARFKLRQKGFAPPESRGVEAKPASLFVAEPEIEAFMSAVDGGGGRLIWIVKPQPNPYEAPGCQGQRTA